MRTTRTQNLHKRLDKLDPPDDPFAFLKHLSNDELDQLLRNIHITTFERFGDGDINAGQERFRKRTGLQLPVTWQEFTANHDYVASAELHKIMDEMESEE